MIKDRLEEIEDYYKAIRNVTDDEINWLISELKKCRAKIIRQKQRLWYCQCGWL